jgi:hypothetical protein
MAYVLTKRTSPNSDGRMMHAVYGLTPRVDVARAWFRSTRTTDVFELEPHSAHNYPYESSVRFDGAQDDTSIISSERLESWREQQFRQEMEQAKVTRSR